MSAERFWAKVEKGQTCWEWTAAKNEKGYGKFSYNGKRTLAHRVSYMMQFGDIPETKVIDHLCRNRACVNPDHMELVSNKENVLRGEGISAQNARKQTCPRGHAYDRYQTCSSGNNFRRCSQCSTANVRALRARRKQDV